MLLTKNDSRLICDNITVGDDGELLFAGQRVCALAKEYGTPLYLYDEEKIRENIREYKSALLEGLGEGGAKLLYASKAASFRRLYEIVSEEDIGIDVVSSGEIYTARSAGFDLSRAYFHSNNKTDSDISYAIECGVGYFVVDNKEELFSINEIAGSLGKRQRVLLRITPGIDPHTYAAVATGKVDSKFGSAIETGQAKAMTELALSLPALELYGYHCHIGSQVFDADIFLRTARVMLTFARDMERELGFACREIDLGGGFGVRYIERQSTLDKKKTLREICAYIKELAAELDVELPVIALEPGRSIVADAGLTVYTVGTVKEIPGYKTYVSVDGGMTDNPRFALYGSPYTLLPARLLGEEERAVSVVGRCCESGDILQEGVLLPKSIKRGDYLCCLTTGAYHYSMASNYNRIPRPPIVMLSGGESYIAVRRETKEDVARLDV